MIHLNDSDDIKLPKAVDCVVYYIGLESFSQDLSELVQVHLFSLGPKRCVWRLLPAMFLCWSCSLFYSSVPRWSNIYPSIFSLRCFFFAIFFLFFFGAEDPALIFCWQWFPGINLCAFGVFIYFPCINTRVFVCVCVYVMAFDLFPLRLIVAKMVKLPCKCTSTDTQQIRIDSIHGIYRLHCNWWGPMWFFRSGFLRDDIVDWTAVFTFFATVFVGTNFGFIIVLAPRPCCPQVIDCGDNNSVGAIV